MAMTQKLFMPRTREKTFRSSSCTGGLGVASPKAVSRFEALKMDGTKLVADTTDPLRRSGRQAF